MTIRLTDPAINRAARDVAELGRRRDLSDAGCPGLRLRLTPTGAKSWVLACRDREGRMRRFSLGSYPQMGLSSARDAARALHAKVKNDGADPTADRRRDRAVGAAARDGAGTLAALLDAYGAKQGAERKSWPEAKCRVQSVFQPLLDRPLAMLNAQDFQIQADAHRAQQSAAAAVRYVRPVLKWGAARGFASAALAELRPPAIVRRRDRVLTRDELAALLPVLRASSRPYAAALRFMLLTLARREEVAQARWRDIDLTAATWTIPETKNGQAHIVPLSRQAVALLMALRPAKALPMALAFHTKTGAALGNWDRESKALMEASGTSGWTRHDLRRTGATWLGEAGTEPHVIEAALNHTAIHSQLAATYNRARYKAQVAAALQRLADALDGIEGAGEPL